MAVADDYYEAKDLKNPDGRARGFETCAASGADIAPGTNFSNGGVRVLELQGASADATIVARYRDPDSGLEANVTFPACPNGWRSLPAQWIQIVSSGTNLNSGTIIGSR